MNISLQGNNQNKNKNNISIFNFFCVFFFLSFLVGCETVSKNNAPNLGKKLKQPVNSGKVVTVEELDDYTKTNLQMAYQYYANKELELSLDKLMIVNKRYPKFPDAYNLLGVIEEDKGRIDEALSNFEKAFNLRSTYATALSNYSRIKCQNGLISMTQELKKYSNQAGFNAAVAECAYTKMEYKEALEYVDKAISLNDKYAQPYFIKALTLNKLADYSASLNALERFHNFNGYTKNSLILGIEMATKSKNTDLVAKYKNAMQQFK